MRTSNVVLALGVLSLVLQGCCLVEGEHGRVCHGHPEPPFELPDGLPGGGLVFGTADFDGTGKVLIKIQVEDTSVSGTQATITAWAGNGDAPAYTGYEPVLPSGASEFFHSTTDIGLRFWTTHILRNYDSDTATRYWVAVKVDHLRSDGTREVKWGVYGAWNPETATSPDEVHDFTQLYP